MRILVNDSSALIDLKKGGLLEVLVELPFEFVVSDALLADELLSFTRGEIAFMRRKMKVTTLNGAEMIRVAQLQAASPALSMHDCSALVIVQRQSGCILLAGDRRLRAKAEAAQVECHGVLWVIEELARNKFLTPRQIVRTLETWRDDPNIRLPKTALAEALTRHRRSQ